MRGVLLAALLVSSCNSSSKTLPEAGSSDAPPAPAASAARAVDAGEAASGASRGGAEAVSGAELVVKFECRRCHDDDHTPPPSPGTRDDKHCFRCHQGILKGEVVAHDAATTARWKKSVARLRDVPSLVGAKGRLRRAWIARFLRAPHDLRPRLDPTMPRLALSPEQADAIAAYYAGEDDDAKDDTLAGASRGEAEAVSGADAAKGRALLQAKGCGSCHANTFAPKLALHATRGAEEGLTPAVTLAPDLRFTRDRLRPGTLAAWLTSPKAMKADTTMPEPGLTQAEVRDIAAYLLTVPLAPLETPRVPARLPVLTRTVSYAEVRARVFRKTCWHCHSDPDYAIGDGGPGNTGGFGFAPRGLNLAEYEGIASGELDEHGDRRSVFMKAPDGEPRILSSLFARQREEANQPSQAADVRGMPLGLPALSAEEIQLVESWVAQGRPR